MKLEIFLLVLLSFLNLIKTEVQEQCGYWKRFCKPPCAGRGCMYNIVIYQMNCAKYRMNCKKNIKIK